MRTLRDLCAGQVNPLIRAILRRRDQRAINRKIVQWRIIHHIHAAAAAEGGTRKKEEQQASEAQQTGGEIAPPACACVLTCMKPTGVHRGS